MVKIPPAPDGKIYSATYSNVGLSPSTSAMSTATMSCAAAPTTGSMPHTFSRSPSMISPREPQ
ncbi:predicted protein [Plenodomus lingam JN3]|uniref:Predicted protein n=1 Tax=Leptosphaeria maculans (strain JN3 / isolate v23.1.3 / race Av1-4-5-6-7-8) TaxID=985895 RepID=E5A524_LEPMJ|nr:predicted protein [Plenodomus lingam JN3]CBX98722.1 predicted protein [Plenodomus lingam JN3]